MTPTAGDGRFGSAAVDFARCDALLVRSVDRLLEGQSPQGDWGDRPADTAHVLRALIEAGLPADRQEIQRAADRLIERLVAILGRTARGISPVELDDAVAAMASLAGLFPPIARSGSSAVRYDSVLTSFRCDDPLRALGQASRFDRVAAVCRKMQVALLRRQRRRGGWAIPPEETPSRRLLEKIPLLGRAERRQSVCPDLTGRVLESLGRWGFRASDENIQRAIASLRTTIRPDGAWSCGELSYSLCATQYVLSGLRTVGLPTGDPMIRAAGDWIESAIDARGRFTGLSTEPAAVRAARALLALIICGRGTQSAVNRIAGYLLEHIRGEENGCTAEGKENHHYFDRTCLTLRALAAWRTRAARF